MTNSIFRAVLTASLCLTTAGVAFAHAGISPSEAGVGQSIRAAINIPHGCEGAATDTLIVTIPEGFVAAKPQAKAGWQIEVTKGDYAKTYSVHGVDVTSGAREIRWSGGSLPDDQFDDFVISGQVEGLEVGASMVFVTTQLCGTKSVIWDQIAAGQDPHSLDHPAPSISITDAAPAHGEHDHMSMAMPMPAETGAASVGDIAISDAFSRASLPNAPVGGGFMTITNNGAAPDRLVSVSADFADNAQLHEMSMDGQVMKMRELPDGIEIPAGGSVALTPGGLHLMFNKLKTRLTEGETIAVTLTFEKAGSVELQMPVAGIAADQPASKH